jgi:hypothetical protein
MGAGRVVRVAGLAVLLVAASALGPLAWGPLREAVGQAAGSKPVVVPVTPFRLFDTRPAPDDPTGGPEEPFGSGETRTYQVAGVGGVPADAVGVVLNLTAVGSTADAFVTLYPAGSGRPNASTLNPSPGRIVFNSATVLLGAGKFSVFLSAGTAHLLADVVGYLVDHNHDERYLEQTQPVVMTETAGGWRTPSSSNPVTFDIIGPDAFMSGAASNPNDEVVPYSLPLTQPASIGGTSYRLASVEYCIRLINPANSRVDLAGIYSDNFTGALPLSAEVTDETDRTAVGCYSLAATSGTARSYALVLGVTLLGSNTSGGIIVSGVRSTWVPSSGAAAVVEEPVGNPDPIGLLPPDVLEALGL